LITLLENRDEDIYLRAIAVLDLGTIIEGNRKNSKVKEAVDALINAFEDQEWQVRYNAIRTYYRVHSKTGPSAARAFVKVLDDPHSRVRFIAAKILEKIDMTEEMSAPAVSPPVDNENKEKGESSGGRPGVRVNIESRPAKNSNNTGIVGSSPIKFKPGLKALIILTVFAGFSISPENAQAFPHSRGGPSSNYSGIIFEKLDPQLESKLVALTEALEDPQKSTAAALELASMGSVAIPYLRWVLRNYNPHGRAAALFALGEHDTLRENVIKIIYQGKTSRKTHSAKSPHTMATSLRTITTPILCQVQSINGILATYFNNSIDSTYMNQPIVTP